MSYEIKNFQSIELSDFADLFCNRHTNNLQIKSNRLIEFFYYYLRHLGAKSIIIELEYTDVDYLDDFASYYATCHKEYGRSCKRFHFFSYDISSEDLSESIFFDKNTDELDNKYLGFMVVRPLPKAVIGRTVIKPIGYDRENIKYCCTKKYNVNLFGITLSIKNSLAFQQQDRAIAACATISLWSAFHKLSDPSLFGTRLPRPAEITKAAVSSYTEKRGFPSVGLTTQQMCQAIKYFGLEIEVVKIGKTTPFISMIYGYIKMGIPVILGGELYKTDKSYYQRTGKLKRKPTERHAITIVGYSKLEDLEKLEDSDKIEDTFNILRSHNLSLYAHDDQNGAFCSLVAKNGNDDSFNAEAVAIFKTKENNDEKNHTILQYEYLNNMPLNNEALVPSPDVDEVFYRPDTIIVPLYQKIRVPFLDIREYISGFQVLILETQMKAISQVFDISKSDLNKQKEELQKSYKWDIHLSTINEIKQDIKKTLQNTNIDIDGEIKDDLLSFLISSNPKFIWRAKLTIGKRVIVDILCDATETPHAFPAHRLFFYDLVQKELIKKHITEVELTEIDLIEKARILKIQEFITWKLGVNRNNPSLSLSEQ